jgi:hypothetical protein
VSLLFPVTLLVAGLDRRAGAEQIAAPLEALGMALFAAGYGFGLWAMRVNAFFSGFARLQEDRGQRLVDAGPYAFVRHPGYAEHRRALPMPLALGSTRRTCPRARARAAAGAHGARGPHARALPGYADHGSACIPAPAGIW